MRCYKCKGTGKLIYPACGGSGEMNNENHYLADISWERCYITCNECYGIGKKICRACNGTGKVANVD